MNTQTPRTDEWEAYCDECYYHFWRLRRKNERGWNDGYHIHTGEEAKGLCDLLNNLEAELTAVTEQRDKALQKIKNQAERIVYLEGATNHATGTPLSKAIEQRDRLAKALEEMRYAHTDKAERMANEAFQSLTTNEQ
jgi:hypothetical protein